MVNENWDRIQRAAADNNIPGEFTCFLGYEWHSHQWGHLWVVSCADDQPMYCARTLGDLQDHFRGTPTILGAHHTAVGFHHEQRRVQLCRCQIAFKAVEVSLDDRLHVRVHDAGAEALVFAVLADKVVGHADGNVR